MPVFILTTVLLCLILKLMTTNSYDLLLFLLLILNMKMHLLKNFSSLTENTIFKYWCLI
ncbi:hypothetical protein Goklo_005278 [Gossypium klotzschianum]|uniref:Uncharacterized protein n=1 Tax=Gossypium klotzschianum TaxID=34286 RepID=A0A7J8VS63_9ROSI|nr:hypothetical protein [Gossypium klotzschianum]